MTSHHYTTDEGDGRQQLHAWARVRQLVTGRRLHRNGDRSAGRPHRVPGWPQHCPCHRAALIGSLVALNPF